MSQVIMENFEEIRDLLGVEDCMFPPFLPEILGYYNPTMVGRIIGPYN